MNKILREKQKEELRVAIKEYFRVLDKYYGDEDIVTGFIIRDLDDIFVELTLEKTIT